MKRLIKKFKKKEDLQPVSRITTETVAEHREKILAGGRRFKYPIQYAKHKLVFNAIIISLSAVFLVMLIGWWQLYIAQNTSEFMRRVTKVIPVPVAVVDGQTVLYGDYLTKYLSAVHHLKENENLNPKTDNGKGQIEYFKQQSMQRVIEDAYALKLSEKLNVSVSDAEVEAFIVTDRKSYGGDLSQSTYDASVSSILGLDPSDYRHFLRSGLLLQKVSYKLDTVALKTINAIDSSLKNNPNQDFKKMALDMSNSSGLKVIYSSSGLVPNDNQDDGLTVAALSLKKLGVSPVIKPKIGTNGYYIIRLLDSNKKQVSYEYINVPLTAFTNSLNKAISDGKVQKYISIPDSSK